MAQLGADVEQLEVLSRKFDEGGPKDRDHDLGDWFSGARYVVAGARC